MMTIDTELKAGEKPAESVVAAGSTPEGAKPPEGQGQGDAQADAGKVVEGKAPDAADKAKPTEGAPEKYEPFKLPEGSVIDSVRMEKAMEYAREHNLTQAQAQARIDTYLQFRMDELTAERQIWADQSEAEFGKDFQPIVEGARRGLKAIEAERPGISDRMETTNLGNHPDVLWLFHKIGSMTKETPMAGLGDEAARAEKRSAADRLFAK